MKKILSQVRLSDDAITANSLRKTILDINSNKRNNSKSQKSEDGTVAINLM